LCTLPAINARYQVGDQTAPTPESVFWNNQDFAAYGQVAPTPEKLAWHTRPVDAILGACLGALLWLAARSIYSTNAANFVLALFAFSPSLIGHFSLAATNDGVITLLLFATAFQIYRWKGNPSWPQTLLLGAVLGGLLISKASAVPFFVIAIALILVLKHGAIMFRPTAWNWRQAGVAVLISLLVVWAAYHFHVSKITFATSDVRMHIAIPNRPSSVDRQFGGNFHLSIPIPAFEFMQGLGYQFAHNVRGHGGFLLGHVYRGGSPLYFPVVVALKWPTMVLVLVFAAIGLILLGRVQRPRDFALWCGFPLLYFLLAEFSKLNLGERYILPVYPFVLLLCGSLWSLAKGRRVVQTLLIAVIAIHVADVARYAPDYLSYFNLFVRPNTSYALLNDSNVDWGEGLIALRKYQQEHPNVPIHLAYFGSVAPAAYGIHSIAMNSTDRPSGTVIVSANYLSGQTLPDKDTYRWVLQYPVKSVLNHSLYVFEIPDQSPHVTPAL
jgi:4-amino-4-deoxy-L-arabinose transferase-like glycosyltransferase